VQVVAALVMGEALPYNALVEPLEGERDIRSGVEPGEEPF
jgi:hypothetical protein